MHLAASLYHMRPCSNWPLANDLGSDEKVGGMHVAVAHDLVALRIVLVADRSQNCFAVVGMHLASSCMKCLDRRKPGRSDSIRKMTAHMAQER